MEPEQTRAETPDISGNAVQQDGEPAPQPPGTLSEGDALFFDTEDDGPVDEDEEADEEDLDEDELDEDLDEDESAEAP